MYRSASDVEVCGQQHRYGISAALGTLVVSLGLLTGCQPPPRAPAEPAPAPVPASERAVSEYPNAKLVLGSRALLGDVELTDPKLRSVGKLTQAKVSVRNLTNQSYNLEYKFDWEDAEGFAVETQSVWHPFQLSPYQVRSFTSTGKKPEAEQIVFTVRQVQSQ